MMIGSINVDAQDHIFSKRFYFKLGKYDIDESLKDNNKTIDSVLMTIRDLKLKKASDIKIHITSYASLESSDAFNAKLTSNRTNALKGYLSKFELVDPNMFIAEANIFDWDRLIELTEQMPCPNKDEALRIMRTIPSSVTVEGNMRKEMLQKLDGGTTYEYMRQFFFPEMRNSKLTITATVPEVEPVPEPEPAKVEYTPVSDKWLFPRRGVFALRTNMLMDAITVPNIGIEAYVSENVSIGFNWMYSWWHSDKHNLYWRTYGGDLHADYWFDTRKHLWSGHHAGIYGQMVTYDFEWKGTGYLGPKFSWGGGINYGYALWINPHITIDFNIGIGYFGGKYYEYIPSEKRNVYLWQKTKHLNWVGPTKLEVSFVWKIGKEK